MTLWPDDTLDGFKIERLVAYQGKEGCTDVRCRQMSGATSCFGYHCPLCDAPTGMMGHDCQRQGELA